MMKRFCLFIVCFLAALPVTAQRRSGGLQDLWDDIGGRNRFEWEYDADFLYIFDNREFAASDGGIE